MKNFPILIFFAASAFLIPLNVDGQLVELEPALIDHIHEAIENNPDIASWREKIEAAQNRLPQAGTWADPMISVGFMNLPVNSFSLNQEPMTAIWINLSQTVPLAGKNGVRVEIANKSLDISSYDFHSRELSIALNITLLWYDWAYLRFAVATSDTTIQILSDIIEIARTKYETGRGLQQDILRLETEKMRIEDKRMKLEQMALSTARKLAALLGRNPSALLDPPGELQTAFREIDRNDLMALVLCSNPQLSAAKSNYELSERKVKLAKRSWWPDIKIGVGYGFRQDAENGIDRPDFFTATAGISLPIYGYRKQHPAVQEAHSLQRQAEDKLHAEELSLMLNVETLLDEDKRLTEQIQLYEEGIEQQSAAALAAAISSYSVGKVDVESLLMAQVSLIQSRLEKQSRIRDKLKVRVNLAALTNIDNLLSPTSNIER